MSGKMKFALVILAFVAPLSLTLLFSAFTLPSSTPLSANVIEKIDTFSLNDDADGDGLSNRDENLWRTDWRDPDTDNDGYTDGEEVLSGHDPIVPGPNDFIDRSKNLTERYASLLLGGVFVGDIAPDSPETLSSFEQVTETVFDEYEKFALAPNTIELTVTENTRDNLDNYLFRMEKHMRKTFPDAIRYIEDYLHDYGSVDRARTDEILKDERRRIAMKTEAERINEELISLSNHLLEIEVPEAMERPHRNSIVLLRSMSELVMVASGLEEDPIKAGLATTSLASLVQRTSIGFVYDYISTLQYTLRKYHEKYVELD